MDFGKTNRPAVEEEEVVLIFDDTIQEKPYTDENEVMCWHYDHTKGHAVQGFNLLIAYIMSMASRFRWHLN